MASNVAGITVGTGHIIISPVLHSSFGGQLNTQLGQQLGGNTGQAAGQSVGRSLAQAMVAGFAAVGVGRIIGKALGTGFSEVKDYQAGLSQLNAGLKSTGGVAGITAGQMEDLASGIQKYSGQTDDSIVATESLLLTFNKVTNQAGAGNDIFTQTTKIAADMAARLGGDASASAIKLGRALQDPAKGVAALTRVGVVFTQSQKDQITAMSKAGDTLGAQKIILKELNTEFGGSAKAFGETLPGQIERAKRSFEDVSQAAVTRVVPAMYSVVGWMGPKLKTGVSAGIDGIRRLWDVAEPTAKIIGGALAGAFRDVSTFVTRDLVPSLRNLWGFISPVLIPVLKMVGAVIVGTIVVGFRALGTILTTVVGPALRAITGFFNSHKVAITSVAIAVGTLIAAWKLYRLTQAAWFAAQTAYAVALRVSQASIASMRTSLTALNATMRANPVLFIVSALIALGLALVYAYKHSETFRNIVQAVFRAVTAAGQWMWNNVLKPVFAALQWTWTALSTAVKWYWDNYMHPVINAFAAAGTWLWNTILKPVFAAISWSWAVLGAGVSAVYNTIIKPVWDALNSAVRGVAAAFGWVVGAVKTAWDKLGDIFRKPINITLGIVNTFDSLVNKVIGAVGITFRLPTDLKLAGGGKLGGYGGGDIVPALLEPGEAVVPKHLVPEMAGWARSRGIPGFATGGKVGTPYDYGTGKEGSYGSFDPVSWVLDKAQHWLRAGAANMLDAGYQAILKPVLGLLGSSMPARMAKGAVDTAEKKIIGWIRGKEHADVGNPQPGPGQSFGLIIEYLRRAGVPFTQADPGLGRGGSSYHEAGQAVDFSGGDMTAMANVFERVHGSLLELIHSPSWFVKNGRDVGAGFYGADIVAQHYNHVHVAASQAAMKSLLANSSFDGGGWLPSGHAGLNLSGRPEAVLSPDQSIALKAVLSGASGGGRPGLFAGANVTIGDRVDLDAAASRHDWEMRRGTF